MMAEQKSEYLKGFLWPLGWMQNKNSWRGAVTNHLALSMVASSVGEGITTVELYNKVLRGQWIGDVEKWGSARGMETLFRHRSYTGPGESDEQQFLAVRWSDNRCPAGMIYGRSVYDQDDDGTCTAFAMVVGLSPEEEGALLSLVKRHEFYPEPSEERILIRVVSGGSGSGTRILEVDDPGFERENYTGRQQVQFHRLVRLLPAEEPHGRLVLLRGRPGTGKTFFLRGLIRTADRCMFLIIPPFMVAQLTDPWMMGMLIKQKRGEDQIARSEGRLPRPFVIVLEDADSCLVPRAADNMSMISTLLNLSDGILGAALDLRIIATTNAKRVELDEALRRPGRMAEEVVFDKLSPEHAERVFYRLTGVTEGAHIDKPVTLAEVYDRAAKYSEGNKGESGEGQGTGRPER